MSIEHDKHNKTVTLADSKKDLVIRLRYDSCCVLDRVNVRGMETVHPTGKVYSGIKSGETLFSTLALDATPVIGQKKNTVRVGGIQFGDEDKRVLEEWIFTTFDDRITWRMERTYAFSDDVDEVLFPLWNFAHLSTWTGALLGNGGVAWFALFDSDNATYGSHVDKTTLWNQVSNTCLRIRTHPLESLQCAFRFTREANGTLTCCCSVNENELQPKHDAGTHRRRYLTSRQDIWSAVRVTRGKLSAEFTLEALDYEVAYPRGSMPSIDAQAVKAVLHTVARIGVIDTSLVGSNSWRTPFGPICLHEQFVSQIGIALDDPDYLQCYRECLDFFRDHAITSDGRVKARWAYTCEDAMPGTCDTLGFYEAQWGYLLDSNPDFVTNVAELFNLNGDVEWVKSHQQTCERALEFMMRRDTDHDGLVEMMSESHSQQRGSDWMDVIWAAHKNAFVNAKMFLALTLWSDVEETLGDHEKAYTYRSFAAKLKAKFNRPTIEDGFWNSEKEWYIHWRDKDGSIHGDNLVIPVNFMAIAYGICDDPVRKRAILDHVENLMKQENLFAWPICLYSYAQGEGMEFQFPFPKYENGDIFLAWSQVGVQAYAQYKPEISLRCVRNLLKQYRRDGLAFQRYSRSTQKGLGDDILANNVLALVGLYRDIYGIRPKPDRLYLEPHIVPELNGTKLQYWLRNQTYIIDLQENLYGITVNNFSVKAPHPFAVRSQNNEVHYFFGDGRSPSLSVRTSNGGKVEIEIVSWSTEKEKKWIERLERPTARLEHIVSNLKPGVLYSVRCNKRDLTAVRSDAAGRVQFRYESNEQAQRFVLHEVM